MFEQLGKLRRGQLSPVLPDKNGYRVFRVLGLRAERPMTFDEAKSLVAEDVKKTRATIARSNLVRFLRQRSDYWDINSGVKLARSSDSRAER